MITFITSVIMITSVIIEMIQKAFGKLTRKAFGKLTRKTFSKLTRKIFSNLKYRTFSKLKSKILSTVLLTIALQAVADDSEKIMANIKDAMPQGLLSVEQHTGKLLLNPDLDKLKQRGLNTKFFIPLMFINQDNALELVQESIMTCTLMSAYELKKPSYQSYRQYKVVRYLQDEQKFPASRVLICESKALPLPIWQRAVSFIDPKSPFKFDLGKSQESGEQFYYYINDQGFIDIYFRA